MKQIKGAKVNSNREVIVRESIKENVSPAIGQAVAMMELPNGGISCDTRISARCEWDW